METVFAILFLIIFSLVGWACTWPEEGYDKPHWYDDPDYPGSDPNDDCL